MRKKNCPLCVLSFDSCECGDGFHVPVSLLRTYTGLVFFFLVCGFVLRTLLELEMGSSFML